MAPGPGTVDRQIVHLARCPGNSQEPLPPGSGSQMGSQMGQPGTAPLVFHCPGALPRLSATQFLHRTCCHRRLPCRRGLCGSRASPVRAVHLTSATGAMGATTGSEDGAATVQKFAPAAAPAAAVHKKPPLFKQNPIRRERSLGDGPAGRRRRRLPCRRAPGLVGRPAHHPTPPPPSAQLPAVPVVLQPAAPGLPAHAAV